ncbi:hypothetical protein ACO0LO_02380 [Undibacterium sp. TJN25]|uniref:hypothetical protein n=1 Tax=Undibacterium sp. TJN25 TaxID=3413056 RepID=UPI003BF0BABD
MQEHREQGAIARRKIAVIGIHGVGEHQCGETVELISCQLQAINPAEYLSFSHVNLNIAVDTKGLVPGKPDEQVSADKPEAGMRALVAGSGSRFKKQASRSQGTADLNVAFTESLLGEGGDYQSEYSTVRLDAHFERSGIAHTVHVHEMFWSDLSHGGVGNSLKVFGQLMQLLLHVASFGRTTMSAVLNEIGINGANFREWSHLYKLNAAHYWLLSMPILLGNALFVLLACLLVPLMLPATYVLYAGIGACLVFGVGCAVGSAYFLLGTLQNKAEPHTPVLANIVTPVVILVITAGLPLYFVQTGAWVPDTTFLIWAELACLGAIGVELMRRYARSRPGALALWLIMCGLLAALGIGTYLFCAASHQWSSLQWIGYFVESLFLGLLAIWALLYLNNIVLFIYSLRMNLDKSISPTKKQAVNTGLVSASIPAPLLLSVILFLWLAVSAAIGKTEFSLENYVPHFSSVFGGASMVDDFITRLVEFSGGFWLLFYFGTMILVGLLMVCGFGPSIFKELFPPKDARDAGKSKALGAWLDGGFVGAALGAFFAIVGFVILLPGGTLMQYICGSSSRGYGLGLLIQYAGAIIGGSTLSFVAATKWFSDVFSGFFQKIRVVVDTAIDVDNWLRERPVGLTPRLKIMARYHSLLKYLETQEYDEIIIIAHSQGTVVTADLFRYYQRKFPAFIGRLKHPKFFSMGCPLRQLYALRFPSLYGWAVRPDLHASGFSEWVNAYGSGDYVGRFLWTDDSDENRWNPGRAAGHSEFCTGPHAHTHYFDPSNRLVGDEINRFIR